MNLCFPGSEGSRRAKETIWKLEWGLRYAATWLGTSGSEYIVGEEKLGHLILSVHRNTVKDTVS